MTQSNRHEYVDVLLIFNTSFHQWDCYNKNVVNKVILKWWNFKTVRSTQRKTTKKFLQVYLRTLF